MILEITGVETRKQCQPPNLGYLSGRGINAKPRPQRVLSLVVVVVVAERTRHEHYVTQFSGVAG
jgi:hypothetical protein